MDERAGTNGRRRTYRVCKRIFDIVLSLVGLMVFAPFAAVIAAAIKLSDGGPVFFQQRRVGQHGVIFRILKFRTMIVDADRQGPSVTKGADPRITWIGRLLRKTKLDEVPQLWNVLRGEMSFVGPRPEVPKYVERYTEKQRRLLQYKPGITDLATLLFRNEESLLAGASNVEEFYVEHCIPRKFELNVQYARRATLWKDLLIIIATLCPYWLGVCFAYAVALTVSLLLAYELRFDFDVPGGEWTKMPLVWLVVVPIQMLCLVFRREMTGLVSYFSHLEYRQLSVGLTVAAGVIALVWTLSGGGWGPPRSVIVIDAFTALGLIGGGRAYLRGMRERRSGKRRKGTEGQKARIRVGIVGAGDLGSWLATELNFKSPNGRHVEVLFDDDPQKWHKRLHGIPIAGMPECILDGTWGTRLDEVILAMPDAAPERLAEVREMLSRANIRMRTVPSLDQILAN